MRGLPPVLGHRWIAVLLVALPPGGCILDGESNHAPVLLSLTAEPAFVLPESLSTLTATASDRDGDALAYAWDASAGEFPGGTGGSQVVWRAPASAGACTLAVAVSDGKDSASGTLEIEVIEDGEVLYTCEVVNRYPHDDGAWTEGLVFDGGCLYEGTGLRGHSTLRRVELESGEILESRALDPFYYGEGITILDGLLYQITLDSQTCFVYDVETLALQGTMSYTFTPWGWGLAEDGERLILSDGTAVIRFVDPETFGLVRSITVVGEAGQVKRLNELEYIDGEIYANVWLTDRIVRIDPATGRVTGWIDCTGLLTPDEVGPADVLNGIAWDAAGGRLFVTGKYWPWVFEVRPVAVPE